MNRCYCQNFEFGTYDPETEQDDTYTTGCTQSTARVFAQGHDAKLVGFLVRAELAGEEISLVEGGMRTSFAGAVRAAGRVSDALALKAQAQLDAARARIAKAAAREATKTARKSAKAAEPMAEVIELAPIEARIKVGRWEYNAQIDRQTRVATYQGKLSGTKTAEEGKYTIL
jgi:hypothetical protein